MANNRSIERHFTRGAAAYHQHAAVQRQAAHLLSDEVRQLMLSPRRILDLGCGTGFLIREIASQYPQAAMTGIDLSPGMIELASQELADLNNVQLMVADAMQFVAAKPFDLIVSSSTLQWLRPYDQLLATLNRQLVAEGWFCASCMLEGTFEELHCLRRELAPHKPVSQRLPTETELKNALAQAGFRIVRFVRSHYEESYASARALFASIRSQGFTGGPLSQGPRALTRGELQQLMNRYDERYRDNRGQVRSTYRCGIFLARSVGDCPLAK